MKDYENNALFWQKLDTLYLSSDFVIKYDKGVAHPDYPNLRYPCAYGYLKTLSSEKDGAIPCFKGSGLSEVNQVIVSADILNKVIEVKVLVGCVESEVEEILRFLNQTDFQKAILVKRGNTVPYWGLTED